MRFKYQAFTHKFSNCPPKIYEGSNGAAYRWVFTKCDEESFKPVLIMSPTRQFDGDDLTCEGYALSMFEQEQGAFQKYKKLVSKKPLLKEIFGTMIAHLNLSAEEGVCSESEINNYTHFNFHEYEGTDLTKKVVTIVDIFDKNGDFKR